MYLMTETNAERLERLKAGNEGVRVLLGDLADKFPQILDMEWVVDRAERVEELEEALGFYAEKINHDMTYLFDPSPVEKDYGNKARQALEVLK